MPGVVRWARRLPLTASRASSSICRSAGSARAAPRTWAHTRCCPDASTCAARSASSSRVPPPEGACDGRSSTRSGGRSPSSSAMPTAGRRPTPMHGRRCARVDPRARRLQRARSQHAAGRSDDRAVPAARLPSPRRTARHQRVGRRHPRRSRPLQRRMRPGAARAVVARGGGRPELRLERGAVLRPRRDRAQLRHLQRQAQVRERPLLRDRLDRRRRHRARGRESGGSGRGSRRLRLLRPEPPPLARATRRHLALRQRRGHPHGGLVRGALRGRGDGGAGPGIGQRRASAFHATRIRGHADAGGRVEQPARGR